MGTGAADLQKQFYQITNIEIAVRAYKGCYFQTKPKEMISYGLQQ